MKRQHWVVTFSCNVLGLRGQQTSIFVVVAKSKRAARTKALGALAERTWIARSLPEGYVLAEGPLEFVSVDTAIAYSGLAVWPG